MALLLLDRDEERRLIRRRRRSGGDRFDEVWDGVYVMSPLPNDEHQDISTGLSACFSIAIRFPGLGQVRAGTNISDREQGWRKNYRCPDVAVFLNGTAARRLKSHYVGGPDFAVEVVSRHDRSREKLDFYAEVGTREVLLVDRLPWALELYRLADGVLALAGRSTADQPAVLTSAVLPLSFRLVAGDERPTIEVAHADGRQLWSV